MRASIATRRPAPPARVAIVGLGPSLATYVRHCVNAGGRHRLADETWAINAAGDAIACDRVFHMDAVEIQEIRAAAQPDGGIAGMLAWMRKAPGPIYCSSRARRRYPGLVEYPLAAVINKTGHAYFNSTVAYAIAFAVYLEVKAISVWGADFTYPNAHHAERGRACVEYWLAIAAERGIEVQVPLTSSLFDMCEATPLYGYGAMGSRDAVIERDAAGHATVAFKRRRQLPTAAQIEAAYDHSKHPSPHARASEKPA